MKIHTLLPAQRLRSACYLTLLIPFALASAGCGTVDALVPERGEQVEALEIDPTEDHALIEAKGARWVLFNLDLGRKNAGQFIRGAFDGAASVGQNVGQRIVEASPEERIMDMFQAARESSRIDHAGGGWMTAGPSLPTSVVP